MRHSLEASMEANEVVSRLCRGKMLGQEIGLGCRIMLCNVELKISRLHYTGLSWVIQYWIYFKSD